jgi:acetyl-CoA acetyltransferase
VAPAVRLTTNLVDVDPEDACVGQRVEVLFEEQDGCWFPLFGPTGDSKVDASEIVALPDVRTRPPASSSKFEDRVVVSGIGISQVGRRLGREPLTLTIEACRAAIADAGLTPADIDGLSTYPGAGAGGAISEGGVGVLEEALQIRPTWHNGAMETPGQAGSILTAMLAVASGLCRHVLCFRTVWESTHSDLLRNGGLPLPRGGRPSGFFAWRAPYGASSAANWIGMQASHYFERFGATRETLGWIALNARRNAALNSYAVYQDPITMDDYLSARMISTPFGLYDCDVPCDSSVAVIISAAETAGDLRVTPIRVEAVGSQITERPSWDQDTFTHLPGVFGPAAHLWTRTDLRPADVDVALLYDGFTFNCLSWLEALGFCDIGEAKDFLDGGARIALDGDLPLNPHGGQLSAGRTHGYGFFHEAVTQLRGDGGERQVDGAQVAVAAIGGGVPGGCFLLKNDR